MRVSCLASCLDGGEWLGVGGLVFGEGGRLFRTLRSDKQGSEAEERQRRAHPGAKLWASSCASVTNQTAAQNGNVGGLPPAVSYRDMLRFDRKGADSKCTPPTVQNAAIESYRAFVQAGCSPNP